MRCNAFFPGYSLMSAEAAARGEESPCSNCGKPFKRNRQWQRFCSATCRMAAWSSQNPRQRIVTEQLQRIETKLDALLK